MKKWAIGFGIVFVLGFVAFELVSTFQQAQKREVIRTVQATDFTLPTLDDQKQTLAQTRGKVVILNFWASWCEPCKSEMPHFQTYYVQHSEDLEILAINYTKKDQVAQVKSFVEQYKLTFPILLDETGETSIMYGAFTLPTTIILDREGNIVHEILGPLDEALLEEYVEPLY
ncbi:TlpA disulfide reductase family protein [Solibacillus sp. FSL R7-0668]|uniref:TlpA family protein disulfide reductase n=1 Tax=Solibacillus sp. FSL R7-0668 TaxID=2921688 RepID=UPI0030F9BF2E